MSLTHTTLAELTNAIHRSDAHTETVTVHVVDLAEALDELEQMIDSDTQEIDHIADAWSDEDHTYHDVWCSPIGMDGTVWRLTLATPKAEACICEHTDSFCPLHNGTGLLASGDRSRFGLVQSVTAQAHKLYDSDPELASTYESIGGELASMSSKEFLSTAVG